MSRIKGFFWLMSLLFFLPACSDDISVSNLPAPVVREDGFKGPYFVDVNFDIDESAHLTRANIDDNNIYIRDLWVGMFDLTTGKIIASEIFETDGSVKSVKLSNVFYNDDNSDVVVVGAANVRGVKVLQYTSTGNDGVVTTFENQDLGTALTGRYDAIVGSDGHVMEDMQNGIRTLQDFTGIIIDASDENATSLLSGVMAVNRGNFTMDRKGSVYSDTNVGYIWQLFEDYSTNRFRYLDFKIKNGNATTGKVYLRRLYSKVSVEITTANGVEIDTENITLQVFNIPKGVYFQERAIVENVGNYSISEWRDVSPAASDALNDGYFNSREYGMNDIGAETDGFFEMNENEGLRVEGNIIKFSYLHFENKHWGLNSVTDFHQREKRFGSSYIFQSLCPSESQTYNNNATYFILKAHVNDRNNGLEGDVEYLIHEGYCCTPNSTQATSAQDAAKDFSTFRNTKYTYDLQIAGMKNIELKVTKEGEPNPAVNGDLWATGTRAVEVESTGNSFDISLPDGDLIWMVDAENFKFGTTIPAGTTNEEIFASQWQTITVGMTDFADYTGTNYFYDNITVNGQKLGDYSPATRANFNDVPVTLTFGEAPLTGNLYICQVNVSEDGLSSVRSIYKYSMDAGKLDNLKVEMPWCEGDELVVGVNDHTVVWDPIKPVNPANTVVYEVYYDNSKKDVNPVVAESGPFAGKVTWKSKYTTVKGDDKQHTFSVIAIEKDNSGNEVGRTEMVSITKTNRAAVWNFINSEWDNVINSLASPPINATVRGLNFYSSAALSSSSKTLNGQAVRSIRTGGTAGSINNRVFRFHAAAKGKIQVMSSTTGGGDQLDRMVTVQANESGTQVESLAGGWGTSSSTKPDYTNVFTTVFEPDLEYEGYNMFIYTNNSLDIYSITFTPQD